MRAGDGERAGTTELSAGIIVSGIRCTTPAIVPLIDWNPAATSAVFTRSTYFSHFRQQSTIKFSACLRYVRVSFVRSHRIRVLWIGRMHIWYRERVRCSFNILDNSEVQSMHHSRGISIRRLSFAYTSFMQISLTAGASRARAIETFPLPILSEWQRLLLLLIYLSICSGHGFDTGNRNRLWAREKMTGVTWQKFPLFFGFAKRLDADSGLFVVAPFDCWHL